MLEELLECILYFRYSYLWFIIIRFVYPIFSVSGSTEQGINLDIHFRI